MNFDANADTPIPSAYVSDPAFVPSPCRILLIEDDQGMAHEVACELLDRDYEVDRASTASQGAEEARRRKYDLLIVNQVLPDCDGLSIIRGLRQDGIRVPILIVSALSSVNDRVRGLKFGGDDYVTKPFALPELAARVDALLRRSMETRATTQLRVGPVELDLIKRAARRRGRAIKLSKSEFSLLQYFMRRPDRVVTRDMLLVDVWHYSCLAKTNLVDVHIGRLRRKLDGAGEEPILLSVRGFGFVFRELNQKP